jgi:type IV secretory pathway VirB9-like protein
MSNFLVETLETQEIDGALGQGNAFRNVIYDYSDLVGDTTSIGFTMLTLYQEDIDTEERAFVLRTVDQL